MKAIPPIKAVMTPFPHWIEIDQPLTSAAGMMAEQSIRHLPVMKDGELVGLLADTDVARVSQDGSSRHTVGDACALGVYVVGLSEPLDRVLRHMAEHDVESALVVKDGKLAGIFTSSDACSEFAKLLRSLFPPGGDSAA